MRNPYSQEYPSLYRGIVEDNIDPENLGRCKVRVPSVYGELTYPIDILPWARPLVLSPVKRGRGSVNLPDIGDIVWVFFEGSEKEFPIYLGGTYATGDIGVSNDVVDFYIENGDSISYSRGSRIYKINIGDNQIIVSPDNITLESGSNYIIVSPDLIHIKGNVFVDGDIKSTGSITADIDVYGQDISLHDHIHGGVESGDDTTDSPL